MNTDEALKILGLKPNFSENDLKKAYKKAAKNNHPDLGGSEDKMKSINEAKNILEKYLNDKPNNSFNNQQNSNYTNQNSNRNYWDARGGSGGSGANYQNTRYYKERSSIFDDFDEFYRKTTSQTKEQSSSSKTAYGTKETHRNVRYNDISEFEKVLSKLMRDVREEQKKNSLIKLIATIAVYIAVLIPILILAYNFINRSSAVGVIWSFARTSFKIVVPILIIEIIIKSMKIYQSDYQVKPEIKIGHSFNSDGTWINIYARGKKVKSFLISNTNYSSAWEKAKVAWGVILNNMFVVAEGIKDDNFERRNLENWGYYENYHGIFQFACEYICIKFMDNPGYVIVTPAGYIVYNGKNIKFLSMDNLKITVTPKSFGVISACNAEINDGKTKINIIYSGSTTLWSELID